VVESLVEAILRRQREAREELAVAKGVAVQTEQRRCPLCGGRARQDNPGPCEKCRPVVRCACGCGRPIDPRRNRFGVSKFCFVRIVAAFRDAPEPLRRALRKAMKSS
jgi:hypothetical protein